MINVYTRGGRVCNPSGWIYNNVTDWHHGTRWRGARAEWWCATHFEKTKTFLFSFFSFVRSVLIRKWNRRGGGAPSAYLAELSNPSIDPQRVGRDAGNSVAWLAQLPQGGSTRRRGRVQRATTSGTTARWRFRLRALPYYARAGGRCDQNRRRRRLARATVVAALHALPGTHRWHVDYWFALDQYRGSIQHGLKWNWWQYRNFPSKCRSFLKFLHFISHPILFNYVTL